MYWYLHCQVLGQGSIYEGGDSQKKGLTANKPNRTQSETSELWEKHGLIQIPCLREEMACHWFFFLESLAPSLEFNELVTNRKQAGG